MGHSQHLPGADSQTLNEAHAALEQGAWLEARHGFEAALAEVETPEALEGLATAAWWLEEPETVFPSREQAYRLFRQRSDDRAAGRLATELGFDYAVFRAELAVANGWLQRAHRLLDDLDPVPEQAWLALREAELTYHIEGDLDRVRELAGQANALAARLGMLDPEMLGLALEGLALVGLGEVGDGMPRLDEAIAAAVAGELHSFQAISTTFCLMVFACERTRDVDRAGQWCERFMDYCQRYDLKGYLAFCRGHYASVLTARGHWAEAEEQLLLALNGLQHRLAWALSPLERLGELRRRQGRLDEAEETFEQALLYPPSILGKARVALDRGDLQSALDLVERALRRMSERNRTERVPCLELLVRIHCAHGEVGEAEKTLRELEDVAHVVQTDCLLALANHARGQLALATDDSSGAKAPLEDALDLYERVQLPFETALVRLDLGRALYAVGRDDSALDLIRTAHDTFRGLGAAAEVARARGLIDQLAGPAGPTILSPRETEVLKLLSRGLSNQEIADELFVSRHTIRRHVSSILTKLDVPSRTAAVAYALEQNLI